MARKQNPFGPDAGSDIGYSLGRALFGDPQAAARQAAQRSEEAQRDAEAQAALARAKLAAAQTNGEEIKNTASRGLPGLLSSMYQTQAAQPERAPMGNEPDDGGVIPAVPGVSAAQAFHAGLPAMIAAMAQSGHAGDADKVTRTLAAFGGDDEMARRGLVAGGNSPSKDFAITPGRADEIAATDNGAKLRQALGVATINNRDDIPVAQIQAGSAANVAGINHSNDLAVANIAAGSRTDVANIKVNGANRYSGGWTPRAANGGDNSDAAVDGKIMGAAKFLGVQPGDDLSHVSALKIAQAMTLSEGGAGSLAARNNNPANIKTADGKGFMVYATPQEGLAAATALVQRKLANGQTTVQSLIEGLPVGKARAAAPRKLSPADDKAVEHGLAVLWNATTSAGAGTTPEPSFSAIDLNGPAKTLLKARTADLLQQGGNIASAAQQATREYWTAVRTNGGKVRLWKPGEPITAATPPSPPQRPAAAAQPAPQAQGNSAYPDARRAPDGKLYVVISARGAPIRYGMVPG